MFIYVSDFIDGEVLKNNMLLQDKVAVVTGGATGLGKAIVLEYLNQGAVVVAADINAAKLELLKEEAAVGDRLLQ